MSTNQRWRRGLLLAQSLVHQGGDHEVGDSRGRRAGSEEHDSQIGERYLRDSRRGVHPGKRHRRRTLDVVVETEDAIPVLAQQRVGVRGEEVLELDQGARIPLLDGVHELVDEIEVGLPLEAPLGVAEIERVAQQLLVVGADVERHGQALAGRDARAGGVERQLPDRNPHAVRAEIAQPQDALAVGDDDHADVLLGPVAEDALDVAPIFGRDEEALGVAREMGELLARFADRRGVDQRQEGLDVIHHRAIEESLVALLQAREQHVAIDVTREPREIGHHAVDEMPLGGRAMGQEAAQSEALPLVAGEIDRPVQRLVAQQLDTFFRSAHDPRSIAAERGPACRGHLPSRALRGHGLGPRAHLLVLSPGDAPIDLPLPLPSGSVRSGEALPPGSAGVRRRRRGASRLAGVSAGCSRRGRRGARFGTRAGGDPRLARRRRPGAGTCRQLVARPLLALVTAALFAAGLPGSLMVFVAGILFPPMIAAPAFVAGGVAGALGAYSLARGVGRARSGANGGRRRPPAPVARPAE